MLTAPGTHTQRVLIFSMHPNPAFERGHFDPGAGVAGYVVKVTLRKPLQQYVKLSRAEPTSLTISAKEVAFVSLATMPESTLQKCDPPGLRIS